ncbi:MAG TPA: DUF1116 domain-containing protein [Solirubrobacteraceae bacterium]|nr:DUF1116 domain-containing protein [Solirubrobacteraceae bacterium]
MRLDEAPAVVTAGLGLFTDSLTAQATDVTPVQWRPPLPGTDQALATVAADPRTAVANAEAVRRLTTSRPRLVAIERAGDALGLERGEFLHAGPPIAWADASGPVRGALLGAMVYENLADSIEAAEALASSVTLAPTHSRHAVGPMAGVISASMPVFVMHDDVFDSTGYCTLNEGLGKVLRFGAYSDEVIDRLRWIERVLAPVLAATLRRHGPVDLPSVLAQALQMGDEGHNRNRAGTSLFIREIVADLIELEFPTAELAAALRFVNGNDHFMLNLAMGMGKAAADCARDLPGATMVVAMARNGTEFGIQTAGTADAWFTGPAEIPQGLYFSGFSAKDANPDLGDSTIMETVGLGGFAMAAAPAIVQFVGGDVSHALENTQRMYEITLAEHPLYQIPALGFRGTPTGIDVTLVARTDTLPVVNTGIAGREPGVGQVGAGIVDPPRQAFARAAMALAARAEPVSEMTLPAGDKSELRVREEAA